MTTATISTRIAELPALPDRGEDRVRIGRNSVAVLDGASGTDCGVSVSEYVDILADRVMTVLDDDPGVALPCAVSEAIALTASALGLKPGRSPSSTVSIVRCGPSSLDTLILGDSPVYVAHNSRIDRLTDDRLARLDLPSRTLLFSRLTTGQGFDDQHRELTRQMSGEKSPYRNRPGGYWIAEADPQAGMNAVVRSYPAGEVSWCVLLTDGADEPASHLDIAVQRLAVIDESGLREVLARIHRWEADTDPDGKHLPRFKQHDDKTVAVIGFT